MSLVASATALELRLMGATQPGPASAAAAAATAATPPRCAFPYEDIEALRAVRGGEASGLFALHHSGGRVALLACEKPRELLGALCKAAALLGISIAVGTELGLPPSTAATSAAARAAAAAAAAAGTADGSALGPHASVAHATAMARGNPDELLAPLLEAPVVT
jgi:hypothetical protein